MRRDRLRFWRTSQPPPRSGLRPAQQGPESGASACRSSRDLEGGAAQAAGQPKNHGPRRSDPWPRDRQDAMESSSASSPRELETTRHQHAIESDQPLVSSVQFWSNHFAISRQGARGRGSTSRSDITFQRAAARGRPHKHLSRQHNVDWRDGRRPRPQPRARANENLAREILDCTHSAPTAATRGTTSQITNRLVYRRREMGPTRRGRARAVRSATAASRALPIRDA